jgi:hypothetical protein
MRNTRLNRSRIKSSVLLSRGAVLSRIALGKEAFHSVTLVTLQEREAAAELANSQVPSLSAHPTKVSPWLELTRWLEYLWGQDLMAVVLLGSLPDLAQEPLLALFSASIEWLIQ